MDKIISAKNLIKKYDDTLALDQVSLEIYQGEVVGILGPNASSKTTLLKALAGIIRLDQGEVKINDRPITFKDYGQIVYMPDKDILFDYYTIKDHLSYFKDMYDDFDYDLSNKYLDYFHLDNKKLSKNLSKGDYKKLMISLYLARNAKIYFLDEILDGIDPISIAKVIDMIIEKIDGTRTFLIASHQINEVENIFDRVIFLNKGSLYESIDLKDFREDNNLSVADFYEEIYFGWLWKNF